MDSKWAWVHERLFLHFLIKSFVRKPVRAPARPISGFGLGRSSGSGGLTSRRARLALSLGAGRLSEVVYVIRTLVRFARRLVQCIFN